MLTVFTMSLICSACSLVESSHTGYIAGGQAEEIAMLRDGKVTITHTYESEPNTKGISGRVYNMSLQDKLIKMIRRAK